MANREITYTSLQEFGTKRGKGTQVFGKNIL